MPCGCGAVGLASKIARACACPGSLRMAAFRVDIEPEEDQSDYYDILLLGRTGQGKSTTANKLLQTDITFSEPNPYTQQWVEELSEDGQENAAEEAAGGGGEESRVIFKTGKGIESVTSKCQLV